MKLLRSFSGREKYQQTLQRSWVPGLAGFCSICTLGFLFLYFQKPIYEASAQLELPENKPSYSASAIASKTLQQRIARAQGQINNITSQAAYIKAKLNVDSEEVGVATIVNKSSQVQELVQQLKKLESQLAQERSRFKIAHKRILKLQEEINHAKQLLRNKIQDIVDFQEKKILESSQLAQIQQELAVKLVKLEASNIGLLQEIHNLSNIQVLSYAIHPDRPISNYFIAYFGLAALGLLVILVIVVAVYLLEVFDKSPKTITQNQKIFDYTWLGVIPTFPALPTSRADTDPLLPQIIVKNDPASDLSESYRMLQSNLNFFSSNRIIKAITITSSVTKEGKSSITANLAYTMAQLGKKVLIIDANLHSPIQHRIWNTHNDRGLSNNIVEKIDPRSTIQAIMSNLDLVSAGTMPAASANLLRSQIMKKLINFWAKLYDCILIDSPALDINSQASILGGIAHNILLVVRPGMLEQKQANLTREILQNSEQNILGMVFNDISHNLESYSDFYRGLEEKTQITPETNSLKKSSVELWETITHVSSKSDQNNPNSKLNIKTLKDIDRDELEAIIINLQQNLDTSTQLVQEQEDELFMKRQDVRKLQRKVNIANNSERYSLENKLQQEQELKNMLNETLIGQRHNLNKKIKILLQYRQLLTEKQYD